jgi:hypothetical protein
MTTRLLALVQVLGLVAGGQQGTRLAERSGIATTPSTLLRQLMQLRAPTTKAVRVLGVDDWSWKKGRRFGTILVDVERHKIIDLLPDRERATFARWLRDHPTVDLISRDRETDYAAAAREAAPQAKQIADRFHLVRNLADVLEQLFARCRAEIRQRQHELFPELPASLARPLPHPKTWKQQPPQQVERKYQAHRSEREERFRHIRELRAQGLFFAEIAKRVNMGERSVRQLVKRSMCGRAKLPLYGNVCSMLPDLSRCFFPDLPSPAKDSCFSSHIPSRLSKHVWLLPSFLLSVASKLTFFSEGPFLLTVNTTIRTIDTNTIVNSTYHIVESFRLRGRKNEECDSSLARSCSPNSTWTFICKPQLSKNLSDEAFRIVEFIENASLANCSRRGFRKNGKCKLRNVG